ncbi:MAG: flippase [Acidobacteriota bacterium]|nr:flippase [Acidobacteriota bacterium]
MPQLHGKGRGRLLENAAALYSLQGLNYLIPMAVLPFLVRVLGMEVYGLVAFSQAFAQYFNILTDYGFNLSATRYIAHHREDLERVESMFWQVLILKVLLMFFGLLILAGILLGVPRFRRDALFFLVAYTAVAGGVLMPQWYFQGMERMRSISVVTGAAKLLAAALLFALVRRPSDGLLAVAIQSGGVLLAGVLGLFVALRHLGSRGVIPSRGELWATARDGWHLFVSAAAVSLYTNTNLVLVGLLAGNVEAGYFSAAEKIIRAMQGLISPLMQAFFPHVNAVAARSREAAVRLISRALRWTAALSFAASAAMFVLAGSVAFLCFGRAAAGSVPVMRWIAFLPFLIAVSNVLGIQTMLTFRYDRQFSRILVASGLLNLALGVPLVMLYGARGAGASVLVTETAVTASMMIFLHQKGMHVWLPRSTEE